MLSGGNEEKKSRDEHFKDFRVHAGLDCSLVLLRVDVLFLHFTKSPSLLLDRHLTMWLRFWALAMIQQSTSIKRNMLLPLLLR